MMTLNNEMGAIEIRMALESPAINRLNNTFGSLALKQISDWNALKSKIDKGNFLREGDKPIPSFEKLLFLLNKIIEIPDTSQNGLINMERLQLLYAVLKPLSNFYKKSNIITFSSLQDFLEKTDILDEKTLLQGSMYLEPPPNSTQEMNVQIKDIMAKRRKLKRLEKNKTTRGIKHQRPEEVKVVDALEKHKDQVNSAYGYAKEQIDKYFKEFKDNPSPATRTKALEITQKELKDVYTTINTELVTFSETLLPKPEEDLGVLVLTDPELIPSDLNLQTTFEWLWNNDKGGFSPFDTKTTLMMELAWNENNSGSCKLTHGNFAKTSGGYIIDFNKMEQINVQTSFGRRVQRRKASYVKKSEHDKIVFELEIEIQKLQDQILYLEKKKKKFF